MIHQFGLNCCTTRVPELLEYTPILSVNSSNIRISFCCCLAECNESNLLLFIFVQVFFRMPSPEAGKLCSNEQLHQDFVHLDRNVLPFISPFLQFLMVEIPDHMNFRSCIGFSLFEKFLYRSPVYNHSFLTNVHRILIHPRTHRLPKSRQEYCPVDPCVNLGFPVLSIQGVNTTGSGSSFGFRNEVPGV